MAALKAHEVEAFLRAPDLAIKLTLVYGPDRGLVSERAEALANAHLKGSADPFALVRLEGDDIAGDAARIADEVYTVALFGGERVVRVRVGAKNILPAVAAVVEGPPPEAALVVEAGDLKGGAPLRKLFEGARHALALPCYADEAKELARLLDGELGGAGLSVSDEARQLLIDSLGGDRLASRQELRKLALYCHGKDRVTEEDVLAISGDVSAIGADAVVDAMGLGELGRVVTLLERLVAEGTTPSVIAGQALRHVQHLQLARAEIDRGRTATDAIRSLVPPIFYKRQGLIERQLVTWTVTKAERAAETLHQAVSDARRHAGIAQVIVERALLSVAALARRRG